MADRDTLLTLAEIAVPFAGFTGIVEAFRRYSSSLYLLSLILGLVSAGILFLVVAAPSLEEGGAR